MMHFNGTTEEIQKKFGEFGTEGEWRNVNASQVQFRHKFGAVMNWYPGTGKIVVQGTKARVPEFEMKLRSILGADAEKNAGNPPVTSTKQNKQQNDVSANPQSKHDYHLDIDSELVIGLVAAVGTDLEDVVKILKERLANFKYDAKEIRISKDIITAFSKINIDTNDNYQRIDSLMTEGNRIRKNADDKSILGKAAAAKINEIRDNLNKARGKSDNDESAPLKRQAFIISSLKQPEEVKALRKIYSNGFFLIGVYAGEQRRSDYLRENKNISPENVQKLIKRDVDESNEFGQHTRDTYHLSDFFINYDGNNDRFERDIWRTIDLIFGKPYVTPTFDEFAMFMAFSSSLRSADLSRQVGAIVAKKNTIVATGANDVPQYGGGQYWPNYVGNEISDANDGRDYTRGNDSNIIERENIIDEIVNCLPDDNRAAARAALKSSKLKNITEYGRIVHAEMDALLSCARENIGTRDADLYCTTFPCHNCAKHIIAAGLKRVVYVEPYPKSKALDFHNDAITLDSDTSGPKNKVVFEPFVGVGPRSFLNLFSIGLGSGYEISRKTIDGKTVNWNQSDSRLRMQMLPTSYLERETTVAAEVNGKLEKINDK